MAPFASESGYTPYSIEEIIELLRPDFNTQFNTTYTTESFVGTNGYKFCYMIAQRVQAGEIRTSEIFTYLQQYFEVTNEAINRPTTTPPGILEAFEEYTSTLFPDGIVVSIKPMIDADAGKISICADVDSGDPDYAAMKLEINTLIKNKVAAGVVSQGTEISSIVLTNGQAFNFKYLLPDSTDVLLRLTTTLSENNQLVIGDPTDVKQTLMDNIAARYALGKKFEPQRYFQQSDAPWASQVLLEWSDDAGANYHSTVFDADFDELFNVLLSNITLIEA